MAMPPPRPQLVFLCINHNVVSNTLVLPPRAICIDTTASFPTSNGFWRLKCLKQSTEEWTMNCKNSAQNALKVAIFRLKIETFSGFTLPKPHLGAFGARRLDTRARPLAAFGPRSSRLRRSTFPPICKSWIRHCTFVINKDEYVLLENNLRWKTDPKWHILLVEQLSVLLSMNLVGQNVFSGLLSCRVSVKIHL